MDEQRTQAYLNLINQLLSCNQRDKPRILEENQELVDQALIEVGKILIDSKIMLVQSKFLKIY